MAVYLASLMPAGILTFVLFSIKFIQQALGLSTIQASEGFEKISTDSRTVGSQELFVALKGDQFDGHDFLNQALQVGASGLLVQKDHPKVTQFKNTRIWVIEVPDVLKAYQQLAAAWRKQFQIPVIAVAGSTGKTTTKELLAAILTGKFRFVLKTQKSENGFVGIPKTLLELRTHHDCAVIEIGIDEIGAMENHIPMVCPTHSLVTTIGPEHLEKLNDVDTVAAEEIKALTLVAEKNGFVAINLDDPYLSKLFFKNALFYTLQPTASAQKVVGTFSTDQLHIQHGNSATTLTVPLPGSHNASNLLAAVTMARGLGLTFDEIKNGLKNFVPAEGRSDIQTWKEVTVICDYYNANPTSMAAAINLLTSIKTSGSRFACLADMRELGLNSEQFHRDLAKHILDHRLSGVVLYGEAMKWLYDELKLQHYKGILEYFSSHEEIAQFLKTKLKPKDTLLIKGSRSMKMEKVWEQIKQNQ